MKSVNRPVNRRIKSANQPIQSTNQPLNQSNVLTYCCRLSHLLFSLSADGTYTKAYAKSTATTRAEDLHLFLNHASAAETNLRRAAAGGERASKNPDWMQGVRDQLETVTTVTKVLWQMEPSRGGGEGGFVWRRLLLFF